MTAKNPIQAPQRSERLKQWIKSYRMEIGYCIMTLSFLVYCILNWDNCVQMQFFSKFDGNNILFIVTLLLIILPFYDIEGKGLKLRKKRTKAAKNKYTDASSTFGLESHISKLQSENTSKSKTEERKQ